MTTSLKKMAADSERTGATLHLSDIEKNPKEMDERGKEASKQQPTTSRTEICCKTLAFLIVLCLVCVHLARVIREGKYCLTGRPKHRHAIADHRSGCSLSTDDRNS